MAVYLIGFALSLGLIAWSEKKRLPVFLAISFFALLIPCLIAGFREQTIGTDVMVYVKPLTQSAIQADDLGDYFNSYWYLSWRNLYVQDYEPGFSLLVYVVANLTKRLGAVLFAVQAFTIVPIFIALVRNRKQVPLWLGMLVYYLLFFNSTLNMMRQWIAMAFLLLAMQMLLERKGGLTILFSVVGFLFHYSAILVIPIYMVYWFIWMPRTTTFAQGSLSVKGSTLAASLFFLVAIFAILNLQLVLQLLSSIGLDRFGSYLRGEEMSLMVNQIILRIPLFVILLVNWKDMCRKQSATPFYLAMLAMDTVASQLVSVDINAIRIGYFFSVYSLLWLPAACNCGKGAKRFFCIAAVCVYALLFWYYTYVLTGRHQTYPYIFSPVFGS